jgi:hypothetical protein
MADTSPALGVYVSLLWKTWIFTPARPAGPVAPEAPVTPVAPPAPPARNCRRSKPPLSHRSLARETRTSGQEIQAHPPCRGTLSRREEAVNASVIAQAQPKLRPLRRNRRPRWPGECEVSQSLEGSGRRWSKSKGGGRSSQSGGASCSVATGGPVRSPECLRDSGSPAGRSPRMRQKADARADCRETGSHAHVVHAALGSGRAAGR